MDNFNRPHTRSQVKSLDPESEIMRERDGSDTISVTGPATPDWILPAVVDQHDTPLHLVADSPDLKPQSHSPVCDGGTDMNDTMPSVDSTPNSPAPIPLDCKDILCYECAASAPLSIALFGSETLYCDTCNNYYVCEVCLPLPQKRHILKCESRLKYLNT